MKEINTAISTLYPTKDWVISDFIITRFGAKAEAGFDNREAFQAAIDAAYADGGGVVYIPAGMNSAQQLPTRNALPCVTLAHAKSPSPCMNGMITNTC